MKHVEELARLIRFGHFRFFLLLSFFCCKMVFKTLFTNILTLVTKNEHTRSFLYSLIFIKF